MTIHFICTGNVYRSRLAEAYCVSRGLPGLNVFSSGIGTALNRGVLLAPRAAHLLKKRGLEQFAAASWQQTTEALVRSSDVLVFMELEHFRFCEDWIDPRQLVEVWNISDIVQADVSGIMNEVEQTFATIQRRTDLILPTLGVKN